MKAIYSVILFLGISAPTSLVPQTISALLFGLLVPHLIGSYTLFRRTFFTIVLVSIYALIIYTNSQNFNILLISVGIIMVAYLISTFVLRDQKRFIVIVLFVMVIGLVLVQFYEGAELRRRFAVEPLPPFNSDMITYVSVVYSLKRGEDFYGSLSKASRIQLDGRDQQEIWGWKQPMLFYLWKVFPGTGTSIIYTGIIVFSMNLVAVYFIGRKFLSPVISLLCPYILWPYLSFPLTEQTIAQVEWWALSAFIFGLAFLLYKKMWLAGSMFAISLGIRELFVIPILFVVACDLFRKRIRETVKLFLPTLVILIPFYLFVHIPSIANFVDVGSLISNSKRSDIPSGWMYIRPTLSYNSWSYALSNIRPFFILLIFNSLVLIYTIVIKKRWVDIILISSFLPFFLISLKIGTVDMWHDYWGIYYVPMVLLMTPITLKYITQLIKKK